MSKFVLGFLTIVAVIFALPQNEPTQEELLKELDQKAVSDFASNSWNGSDVNFVKAFVKSHEIDETETDSFKKCFLVKINDGTIKPSEKATVALNVCLNEFTNDTKKLGSYVDLEPFFYDFSAWDGSYRPLERKVKEALHDPSSFEHLETFYKININEKKPFAIIKMKYRAKNGFGALRLYEVSAIVYLTSFKMIILENR